MVYFLIVMRLLETRTLLVIINMSFIVGWMNSVCKVDLIPLKRLLMKLICCSALFMIETEY